MKTIISVILIAFFSLKASAQTSITVGAPYVVVDASSKEYFAQGKEIMSVKVDRKGVTIQKFQSDNLAFKTIKLYDDLPKNWVVEKVTQFQDRYYLFYSYYDGEKEQLFSREIDFRQGQFKGPGTKILTVDEKLSGTTASTGFYRVEVLDKFSFFFSSDSSKLLVQYRLKPEVKRDSKNYDVIGMAVFDKSLRPSWEKKVKMPYTEKKMNNLDYVVDRKGNAYIVTMVYDDDTTDEKDDAGNPNYSVEILKMNAGLKEVAKYPVTIPDKFVQTLWIYESPKGHLVCAGFYNKGKRGSNADGILMFKLSEEGKTSDMNTYEIPLEVLNQYARAKSQRKNEKKDQKDEAEFEHLKLREILFDKDGSMLLLSEQYFYKVHTTYMNGRSSSYTTYHYNDMLVTKVTADGKMAWMKKLPKRQVGRGGLGGMSYKYVKSPGEHYFLFLDNQKNKDLELDKLPAVHADGAGGFLTAYRIDDKTGAVSKHYLLDTRDINGMEAFQFKPSRIVATNRKEFVFEVYKKKKEDVLVKVKM